MVEQQIYQDQTKLEVEGKVFRIFSSSAPSRQISLQTQITKEIVFHISLLEQNSTSKGRVDENNGTRLDVGKDSGKYKIEAIWNNAVYARELMGYLPGLYYLVFWKDYLEKENTWKPASAVQHLRKLISLFYKNYSNKPTAISEAIDTVPPMAKPIIKPAAKPTALKPKQG